MNAQKRSKKPKIARIKKTLADGRVRFYYYTRRDGVKFWESDGEPVDLLDPPPLFWLAKDEADNAACGQGASEENIDALIRELQGDAKYRQLAKSTRATYRIYFKEVSKEFGAYLVEAFAERRIRKDIIAWRNRHADKPRAADYRVAALSRVLKYAVDTGRLKDNHAKNIDHLHSVDRSEIIWTPEDLALFVTGSAELGISPASAIEIEVLTHARYTGLRRADLAAFTRSADKGNHLELYTGKSRGRREAVIPIVADYRAFLDELYRHQDATARAEGVACLHMIRNSQFKPYIPTSIGSMINDRAKALGINKHLHDLRGTFATELMRAGFNDRSIGECLGWSPETVRAIRRKYISRREIVLSGKSRLEREQNKS